jgi:hypothetical protein
MDFTHTPHGSLTVGTATELGTIEQVSYTAYRIGGRWIPFGKIHGPYRPAEILVTFG